MERIVCNGKLVPRKESEDFWLIECQLTIFETELVFILIDDETANILRFPSKEEAEKEIDRIEGRTK